MGLGLHAKDSLMKWEMNEGRTISLLVLTILWNFIDLKKNEEQYQSDHITEKGHRDL